MLINKFVATKIELQGLNSYLAEMLNIIISTACEDEDETPLLVLMKMQHLGGGWCFLEDFVDLPLGEEGDRLYIKYESDIFVSLLKILKEQNDLIDLLCDCYKQNVLHQILGLRRGIWVEING